MEESKTSEAWEKVLEYASVPLHGTMSRRIRKGVKLQINEGKIYENAVIFISEAFVRITEEGSGTEVINTYFSINQIASIRTYSEKDA